ncbi:hypothetical protein PFISCL1PPCAC_19460, partial [Pristionchus fissidentatus]
KGIITPRSLHFINSIPSFSLIPSFTADLIMANVELSLDDIIARNKANKRGGASGRSRGGRQRNGGSFNSRPIPSSLPRPHINPLAKEINAHKRVRINISHLAPSVRTGDLEELFSAYNLESASVNYGEGGHHLGTGDIVMTKRDAHRVLNDFHGVTVDGQRLTMVLVEDGMDDSSIFNRIKLANGGGVHKRPPPRPQQQIRRGGAVSGRGGRGAGRGGRIEKKPRTEADLDAELDAYMTKKGL